MAEYRFTETAEYDLQDIVDYTLHEWGEQQALDYIDGLEERCQMLADNPSLGVKRDRLMEGLHSFVYQNHVLFYLKEDTGVVVVRVLHQGMDHESLRSW